MDPEIRWTLYKKILLKQNLKWEGLLPTHYTNPKNPLRKKLNNKSIYHLYKLLCDKRKWLNQLKYQWRASHRYIPVHSAMHGLRWAAVEHGLKTSLGK